MRLNHLNRLDDTPARSSLYDRKSITGKSDRNEWARDRAYRHTVRASYRESVTGSHRGNQQRTTRATKDTSPNTHRWNTSKRTAHTQRQSGTSTLFGAKQEASFAGESGLSH